ncbi:MAG: IS630 family transposase [Nanoarchaeota archaeon]
MKRRVDGRKLSRDVLEQYRFRAIAMRKEKWQVNEIALFFGINRVTVSTWLSSYRRHGKKGLKKRKAKGAEPKLKAIHKRKILQWLKKPATDFGFETPLWTCKRLEQLIKKKLKISIHLSNVWKWLQKWDLSCQKPERMATQCNEKEMICWVKEEWPKIKAHARRWQAMLYFQDEAGVSLTPVLGTTWAPKGETPVVKVTGKRGGLCVTSAISPAGRMVFRIEKGKVNAEIHIEFLEQIMQHHPNRKVIVVEDRAPVHRAKKVKQFVEKNRKRFALYYLPSYSPKLNPDEHVWAYLKNHELKAHQAQTTKELKKLVDGKMRKIQKKKKIVDSFFYGTYVV